MKEIGIGLIGFGTVGAGVVEALQRNGSLLADRTGVLPVLRRIADVDIVRDRGVKIDPSLLTQDALSVIQDPGIDIVVELVGGTTVARTFILEALQRGKTVVTANKALLAEHGGEIVAAAAARGVDVWFEASVAGGIPIIRALRDGLVVNRIGAMYGILNGTCNYILTRMEREQMTFEHALKEAQAAGYAEADPGLDIDGHDTAHKAAILASLAYGVRIPMQRVYVEGIRGLARLDIEYARNLGYRVKLLAVIKNESGSVDIRVHPTLVPVEHMLASVMGVFNAVVVDGDIVGQTVYYGRGAGRLPTASAVVSDIAEAARGIASGTRPHRPAAFAERPQNFLDMGDVAIRHYLRLALADKPGVLGIVATELGRHNISLASVVQKEPHTSGRSVPVVVLTHPARERDVTAALRALEEMQAIGPRSVRLRIEDLGIEKNA